MSASGMSGLAVIPVSGSSVMAIIFSLKVVGSYSILFLSKSVMENNLVTTS